MSRKQTNIRSPVKGFPDNQEDNLRDTQGEHFLSLAFETEITRGRERGPEPREREDKYFETKLRIEINRPPR